tara:strand:+ start:286 stop:510 length:225 start_codon:yes stop_codon:yes gene_type:complete
MNAKLYKMLKSGAEADLAKADLTMELLGDKAAGIGDHSTGDFYKNAEEALSLAADAMDRLEALKRYDKINYEDS